MGCCTRSTTEAATTGTGLASAGTVPEVMLTATGVWFWAGTADERLRDIYLGWEAPLWVDVDGEGGKDGKVLNEEEAGDMDEEDAVAVATVLFDDVGYLCLFPLVSLLRFLMGRRIMAFALRSRNGARLATRPRACGLTPVNK